MSVIINLNLDENLLSEYERREMFLLQQESLREEGEAIGSEKGKIEIAKNLILMNMSVPDIAKVAGLGMEDVEKLVE